MRPEAFEVSISPELLAAASPAERRQLNRVAEEIQSEAGRELDLLTRQLDLTPAQQEKIFPLLVQANPGFAPGIDVGGFSLIDGTNAATGDPAPDAGALLESPDAVEDAIYNELDPDQQEDMVEVAIDNQNWWAEIVDQLEEDLDTSIGAVEEPAIAAMVEGDGEGDVSSPGDPERVSTEPVPIEDLQDSSQPEAHQGGNIFDLFNE